VGGADRASRSPVATDRSFDRRSRGVGMEEMEGGRKDEASTTPGRGGAAWQAGGAEFGEPQIEAFSPPLGRASWAFKGDTAAPSPSGAHRMGR